MKTDECKIIDKIPVDQYKPSFNLSVINEIAAVITGNEFVKRDILRTRSNKHVTVLLNNASAT